MKITEARSSDKAAKKNDPRPSDKGAHTAKNNDARSSDKPAAHGEKGFWFFFFFFLLSCSFISDSCTSCL